MARNNAANGAMDGTTNVTLLRGAVCGVLGVLALGLSACAGGGWLPEGVVRDSELVARSVQKELGLLFVAPSGGTAALVADGQTVAQITMDFGDELRLNDWEVTDDQPWTVVTVNGEEVYSARKRSLAYRLYFLELEAGDEEGRGGAG